VRIAGASSRRVRVPLARPYAIAGARFDAVEMVSVELVEESGARGFGSASPATEITGETVEACERELARLDWLASRGSVALDRLLADLYERVRGPAARAAVDIALHDLSARLAGRPLADVLGRVRSALPTSITIGILPLDRTLDEADEHVAHGFRALKIKVGEDVDGDLERLTKLRERFGDAIALRADANEGYDAAALARFAPRMDALDLEIFEQPLPRGAEAELRALPERLRARIALDESVHDERDLERMLLADSAFGIAVVKLMKCGGVADALRLARLAERAKIDLMWGCMDESCAGIAAALHAACASRATRYLDLDGSFDLARDPFSGGFELRAGQLATLARPGLGVEPA
jgi:L-alanine-DL-glutamate epimerase-like enolase superfamily enzyme